MGNRPRRQQKSACTSLEKLSHQLRKPFWNLDGKADPSQREKPRGNPGQREPPRGFLLRQRLPHSPAPRLAEIRHRKPSRHRIQIFDRCLLVTGAEKKEKQKVLRGPMYVRVEIQTTIESRLEVVSKKKTTLTHYSKHTL